MKSINDAFKFESTIEEKENVFIPVNDKVKPREWVAFILVGFILIILAVLPVIYEQQQIDKEIQRRSDMTVTLDDDN